jgi:hypothetical protein
VQKLLAQAEIVPREALQNLLTLLINSFLCRGEWEVKQSTLFLAKHIFQARDDFKEEMAEVFREKAL